MEEEKKENLYLSIIMWCMWSSSIYAMPESHTEKIDGVNAIWTASAKVMQEHDAFSRKWIKINDIY